MIGTLLGVIAGIGMCVEAWNGQLQAWTIGAAVVLVLIGFIFPITVGIFLMGVSFASPIAAILCFVAGNSASGVNALLIGVCAFVGQFIIGRVRMARVEY